MTSETNNAQPTTEIFGNVGSIGQLRTTKTKGVQVLNLTVAQNVEGQENPNWYEVTIFGPRAARYAQELSKGAFVRVQGPVHTETYPRKNGEGEGSKRVIIARQFGVIRAKKEAAAAS